MSDEEQSVDKSKSVVDNLPNVNKDDGTAALNLSKQANDSNSQEEKPIAKSESVVKPPSDNNFHLIKWIDFNFERLPIILQNVNGPCPLLAIFNILLLQKRITVNSNTERISVERVITLLADYILERDQTNISNDERANYEQNVHDALAILDKLKTGLDVNLKFDGVNKFEYTRECIIFDLLSIHLYHGWIIDPQDVELRTIIATDAPSYNQLVEKMIRQRQSEREELLRESLLIEQFLDENRSQLTHYGILQLNETMRENQLAVFFRNNHFSTIWKHENQLLLLVSDQGYIDHASIVFETLTDIDNDSIFTDGYGRIWSKTPSADSSNDHNLAMALHNEEERLYHASEFQTQNEDISHKSTRTSAKQQKKSKNKQRESLDDESERQSCALL